MRSDPEVVCCRSSSPARRVFVVKVLTNEYLTFTAVGPEVPVDDFNC